MKDYHGITTEPFRFLNTDKLEIRQEMNEHAVLNYSGLIDERDVEEYRILASDSTWMTVKAEDSGGESQVLFCGFVTAFKLENTGTDTRLEIECMSGTCLLDTVPRLRTFQNNRKTYDSILEEINRQYSDVAAIAGQYGEKTAGEMAIQYHETDWAFLKRLASCIGGSLTAACHIRGIRYYWGMPELICHEVDIGSRYRIEMHMDDYLRKEGTGQKLFSADSLTCIIEDRQIYRIGERIRFLGQELIICRIKTQYRGGECIHTYYLRTPGGLAPVRLLLPEMAGASLAAVVTAVKQDMVQVQVREDANREEGNVRWFPYSTVYSSEDGTGWYCMPETGDEVRLHIPSGREEEAYVISAVHLKSETSRQNPDHKSVKNRQGISEDVLEDIKELAEYKEIARCENPMFLFGGYQDKVTKLYRTEKENGILPDRSRIKEPAAGDRELV